MDGGSGNTDMLLVASSLIPSLSFSQSPFTLSTPTSTPSEEDNLLHDWLVRGISGICAIIAILVLTIVILCCCCCYFCCIHNNMKKKGSGKIVKFADSEGVVELISCSIKALETEDGGRVDKGGYLPANDSNKENEVTSELRNDKKALSPSSFVHKDINTDFNNQDDAEAKTVTADVEPPQDLQSDISEVVSKLGSPENKDIDKLGPKNTRDVDKGTPSNTKPSHESKHNLEPNSLLQTQNQDANERSDEEYKKTPIAVVPPKLPLLLEPSEQSIPHDVKNGSTTFSTSAKEMESDPSQPADGDDKLTAAELLSFADIEKSLGIALEGLGQ